MCDATFISCLECIFFEDCQDKESRDGCYFGEKEEEDDELYRIKEEA